MLDKLKVFSILNLLQTDMRLRLQLSVTAPQGAPTTAASPLMTEFAKIVTLTAFAVDGFRVTTMGVEAVEDVVVVVDAAEATVMTDTAVAFRSKQTCPKKSRMKLLIDHVTVNMSSKSIKPGVHKQVKVSGTTNKPVKPLPRRMKRRVSTPPSKLLWMRMASTQ